ncbi:hypothetical protein [Psychrobacter lutiphocae]|uniref:hypothetical protein n=1 Tax=Psychrobacter lutiphocae TaxID=540500 RepID=UPI000376E447|nr:hypothetical protein [Psychrobacter lutiphocae]
MRYSKLVKLSVVGLALLLIPRRSSRQSQRQVDNGADRKPVSKSSQFSKAPKTQSEQ